MAPDVRLERALGAGSDRSHAGKDGDLSRFAGTLLAVIAACAFVVLVRGYRQHSSCDSADVLALKDSRAGVS